MSVRMWLAYPGEAERLEAEEAARLVGARDGLPRVLGGLSLDGMDERSGVAVVSVSGALYARGMGWRDSYEEVAEKLAELGRNPAVRAVMLRVDSPGGEVPNVRLAVEAVRALREKKPVWAHADPMAASAAYWIASQAERLTVSPGGLVGSIGAIMRHVDRTKMAEQMGLTVTEVVFGSRKNEFSPFKALDERARAHMQALVDEAGEAFVSDVAEGRGVTADVVRATEGAALTGPQAVELKLADGEETFPEALAGLIARVAGKWLGPSSSSGPGPGSVTAMEGDMADKQVGAAPPLPTDAVGGAAAGAGAPAARQADPSAPRVDLNVLVGRMSACGLNDLGLASALQASAVSTDDAARIAQLYAIAGKPEWLRAEIAQGRGLKASEVQERLAARSVEADRDSVLGSGVLPGEGMRSDEPANKPNAALLAAVDRFNERQGAQGVI